MFGAAIADERATILADKISFSEQKNQLTAVGSVEVYFQDKLLQTDSITYTSGVITAEGPLTLTDSTGSILLANYALLDTEFKSGVLEGVEMLLDGRFHIVGESLEIEKGRYVLVRGAQATTCQTCQPDQSPPWHFRARTIVHDRVAKKLYLRNAQFVLGDIPLLNIPSISLPDPTVQRTSGFLLPKVRYSDTNGLTVGIPYFRVLEDHSDFTLTPNLNNRSKHYLGFEARQRFTDGWIDLRGSFGSGHDHEKSLRGHLEAEGEWKIGSGYELSFFGIKPSDPSYLNAFGILSDNSLWSRASVTRRTKSSFFEGESIWVQHLDSQVAGMNHSHRINQINWRGRRQIQGLGGTAGLSVGALWFDRIDNRVGQPNNIERISTTADWTRQWIAGNGLSIVAEARVTVASYAVDPSTTLYQTRTTKTSNTASLDLSWPLIRSYENGRDLLEPFMQMVRTKDDSTPLVPNEDSVFVEFDETNLRSIDRLSGDDRNEDGLRVNAGLKLTRQVFDSYDAELLIGRVFRTKATNQFNEATGLSGRHSDFVASADLEFHNGVGLRQSLVADADLDVSKSTSSISIDRKDFGLQLGYSTLIEDTAEGMTGDSESIIAAVEMRLNEGWSLVSNLEYDFDRITGSSVGIGIKYSQNCLDFAAAIEHELSTAATPQSNNKLSLSLSLGGFRSAGPSASSATAACPG